MTNIIRAIIRIDIEDYLRGLKNHPGYIDGTDTFFAPSEEVIMTLWKKPRQLLTGLLN